MIEMELWMFPAAVILSVVGLVTAGYLWGLVLDVKQRLTNDAGDIDE